MPVIGITGGAASGKSRAAALLALHFPEARLFSADQAVEDLYGSDPEVATAVAGLLGGEALTESGGIDRGRIRERVFDAPELRAALNAVVHPRVRARWREGAREARESKRWFFAEIPLLYETDGQAECDQVVVVACTVETQIRRMTLERKLSENTARQILGAQWSTERKVQLGDFLVWNDSSLACLQRQVGLLAHWLFHTYA
jgi:dephospho-CoA kinase